MRRSDRILIVALADGRLSAARRARAEARLARVDGGERMLERQRRVGRALRLGSPPAAETSGARRAPRWRPAAVALAGAAGAVVLAVLAISLPGGAPVVADVTRLSMLPAEAPAPAGGGTTLRADLDGVRFPDPSRRFGWRAEGVRSDRLKGRDTRTVFYAHTIHRIGYTIVSGPPLQTPDGATRVRRAGVEIALYRDAAGHDVAVFERDGHTCVLAGHVMHRDTLVKLAAWRPA